MSKYFLVIIALLMVFVFACTQQQPGIPSTPKPEKIITTSTKTTTIKNIVDNPYEFLNSTVQVTGKLIIMGKSYFDAKFPLFALTDGVNNLSVTVWAPLEVPPPFPGSEGKPRPILMSDYLNKILTIQGVIKKFDGQIYLEVIKVIIEESTKPMLKILSPKDGELIKSSKVTVELKTNNFNIVPVGEPVKEGEGHFHIWLDSDKKVTVDNIVTFENIVSGKHTIVAELLKSDHSSLSPKVTKTIIINVESDYVPKVGSSLNEFTVEADDNGFYPSTIKAKIGDKVRINFKFRDNSIYFAGLDVKGPFEDIKYKLKGDQPITREFVMKDETRITSYWPASGVKKATLTVDVEK